jgi:hypothetical protein
MLFIIAKKIHKIFCFNIFNLSVLLTLRIFILFYNPYHSIFKTVSWSQAETPNWRSSNSPFLLPCSPWQTFFYFPSTWLFWPYHKLNHKMSDLDVSYFTLHNVFKIHRVVAYIRIFFLNLINTWDLVEGYWGQIEKKLGWLSKPGCTHVNNKQQMEIWFSLKMNFILEV